MSHNANRKYMGANDGSYDSKLDFEQDPFRNIDEWYIAESELPAKLYIGRKELVPEYYRVQKELVIVCLIYAIVAACLLLWLHLLRGAEPEEAEIAITIDGEQYPQYVADEFEKISQWGNTKKEQK